MTCGGWINLILSVGLVTGAFLWCLYKVFTTPGETEHLHGFEIETPDTREE